MCKATLSLRCRLDCNPSLMNVLINTSVFSGVMENVVELVNETMAEAARSCQWQRVFPCSDDPERYLGKFEMQRSGTKRVCQALKDWDSQRPQDVVVKKLSQCTSRAWR